MITANTRTTYSLRESALRWYRLIAVGALLFSAVVCLAADDTTPPVTGAPDVAVTLQVDYSNLPQLTIHARGVSPDELMTSLAEKLGFTVKRLGKADAAARLNGRYVGLLTDLLPILLRGEGYVVILGDYEAGGQRKIDTLLLLDSHRVESPVAAGTPNDALKLRTYLDQSPAINKDLRKFLTNVAEKIESGKDSSDVNVTMTDVPETVTDMLARISEPLTPEFAANRLENRAPGTPPRYLTGANDAAQQTMESALARTTALAARNLEVLSEALRNVCFDAGCPGITSQEIAEREAREAAAARASAAEKEQGD